MYVRIGCAILANVISYQARPVLHDVQRERIEPSLGDPALVVVVRSVFKCPGAGYFGF